MSNFLKQIFGALIVVAISLLALIAVYKTTGIFKQDITQEKLDNIQEKVENINRVIIPYERKNDLHRLLVASEFKNTTENEKATQSFSTALTVSGHIASGYLYVIASVNNKPLSQYDSIYMKLGSVVSGQYQEFGGHLRRDKSLETPKSESKTELLYILDDIKYKDKIPYYEDIEVLSVDWLRVLKEGKEQKMFFFSSTLESGNIHEVDLYYQCATGEECSISLK